MVQIESIKGFFDKGREAMSLAQKLLKRIEGKDLGFEGDYNAWFREGGGYKFIAGIFLHSAIDDFDTIFLLLDKEQINGAFLSVRRLLELDIDLRFIGKKPAERAKQFLMFQHIQQAAYLTLVEKHWPESFKVYKEIRETIISNSESAMNELGYKKKPRQWSRYDYSYKCKKINWEKHYEILYKLCCMYTHPSPHGIGSFLVESSNGDLIYTRPLKLLNIIAPIAISILLDIVTIVNRQLGAGMSKQIDRFYKSLKKQGWIKF